MSEIINAMIWEEPVVHKVNGANKLLKYSRPTQDFWEFYRANSAQLNALGISVAPRGSHWVVKYWSNEEGQF